MRSFKRAKKTAESEGKSALDPVLLLRYQALYRRLVARSGTQRCPQRTGQRTVPTISAEYAVTFLRKQGTGILIALQSVFMGNFIYPCLDPTV